MTSPVTFAAAYLLLIGTAQAEIQPCKGSLPPPPKPSGVCVPTKSAHCWSGQSGTMTASRHHHPHRHAPPHAVVRPPVPPNHGPSQPS